MTFKLSRTPKALSYSSMSLFYKDAEEFFLRYLAGNRPPRLPQENYMAVGSSFDAYVKSELHAALYGRGQDPRFEFGAIFEAQVEKHNWDFGLRAGKHCFRSYVQSGAYDDLFNLLAKSVEPVQFETSVDGQIEGVPYTGKPDCRFVLEWDGFRVRIILDWKVKGYCSKYGASPSPGYMLCRDGYDAIKLGVGATKKNPEGKQSKSHNTEHGKYLAYDHHGLKINAGMMEHCNEEYADQVASYGWLLGEKIGDENVVVWIDELVATYREGKTPLLRVATHRARVGREHQLQLLKRITGCWDAITSGHIFQDMDRESSDNRCKVLESTAVGLQSDGSAGEDWFNQVVRPQFRH